MSTREFSVRVPAVSCYLRSLRAFFQSVLAQTFGDETDMIVLALDESCSNVLKYRPHESGEACLQVKAELERDVVRFRIENFCRCEDVPKIKPRDLAAVRPGGLGTHFVKRIMDKVEFEPESDRPGHMALVLEKALPKHETRASTEDG